MNLSSYRLREALVVCVQKTRRGGIRAKGRGAVGVPEWHQPQLQVMPVAAAVRVVELKAMALCLYCSALGECKLAPQIVCVKDYTYVITVCTRSNPLEKWDCKSKRSGS